MVMILYPRNSQYTGIELSTGVVFDISVWKKCCGGPQGILNFDAIKGIPNVWKLENGNFIGEKPIKNSRFKGINDDYFFNFFSFWFQNVSLI